MEYHQLGRTGVRVSKVCLGTMNFGSATDEETSIRIMNEALDAGINFVDTADAYTHGASEEIVGKALAGSGRRDQVVLASKAVANMGEGPNDWGASRYHLVRACEDSLRRLRTDRIDLFYLHIVDLTTPMDEIFETLDILVRQGKILYVGTSKWSVPLIMEALALSERCGLPRIVAEQPPYNLLDRGIENELVWVAMRYGIAIVTWGPLGGGILSGKYRKDQDPPKGSRYEKAGPDNNRLTPAALDVVEKLRVIADAKGISLPELCHARLLHRQGVVTPIVGPRTEAHLRSALKACEIEFSPEEVAQIDRIVPPGSAVSDFYEGHIYGRMRRAAPAGDPMAY